MDRSGAWSEGRVRSCSGRTVSVKSHRVDGDSIVLLLRTGGEVTCDRSLAPNVAKAHQNLTFTTPPNLQRAVAVEHAPDESLPIEDSISPEEIEAFPHVIVAPKSSDKYTVDGMLDLMERELEARGDVLSYTSDELERDLEVIGPVEMVLFAASSAKDTDFFVRICDVYPDERSIFLTEGLLRARYRNSHEGDSTELLEPGEVAEYRIRCYPMANVFERGHRIRLDVTSSSFPRFSRNLNTGEDVGTGTRIEVAQQTVLHTDVYPSHVLLPVIPS